MQLGIIIFLLLFQMKSSSLFFWANVALNEFSQLLFIIVSWNRLGKEK
jgi:hypothetical protein